MSAILHPPSSTPVLPLREGDRVFACDCPLAGRIKKVFPQGAIHYYRVRYPMPSPFFDDDEGVIYRQHEITVANKTKEADSTQPSTESQNS